MGSILFNLWAIASIINFIFSFIVFDDQIDEIAGKEFKNNSNYEYSWYRAATIVIFVMLSTFPIVNILVMILYFIKSLEHFRNND